MADIEKGNVDHPDLSQISKAFHHWRAREITIETDQPQATQGDGEIGEDTPITIKVLPAAMNVFVPDRAVS